MLSLDLGVWFDERQVIDVCRARCGWIGHDGHELVPRKAGEVLG